MKELVSVVLLQGDSIGSSEKQMAKLWTWNVFEGMVE
ncbi:hypothetical protein A2U01_0117250, partial [Trifolium medium]|nr:hypothetical protein [Trifolium medium]